MKIKQTTQKIKEKFEYWRKDPLTSPAGYRLLAYLPWEEVPEEIKGFMPENAEEEWNNNDITADELKKDLELTIKEIYLYLTKQLTVTAYMFVPVLLADIWILGKGTGQLEGQYRTSINAYGDRAQYDRPLAEAEAILSITDLIKKIAKKVDVELPMDLDELANRIIVDQDLLNKEHYEYIGNEIGDGINQNELDTLIDKALKDYEEETGESALHEIELDDDEPEVNHVN